jgi:dihydroflavonol-4-reductase
VGLEPAYLITGSTGFLGRHILESLRKHKPNARVVVLVRDSESWERQPWRNEAADVEVVAGSLTRIDEWKNDPRLDAIDGIFHLAAIVRHSRSAPEEMIRVNVEGTASMVRLAAEKKCRLLFASSSGTVGCSMDASAAPDETAPFAEDVVAGWPYYASKIQAEKRARALANELGVDLIVFRPPVMLGPKDHRFRSTGHLLRLLEGKLPFLLDGEIHFVDIRDVADAMVRAMFLPAPKPAYNLPGHVMSLDRFFRIAAAEAGIIPSWRVLPARILWYLAKLNEMTGRRLHFVPDPVVIEMARHHWGISSRYASNDLGFVARPAQETLRDTVQWMKQAMRD